MFDQIISKEDKIDKLCRQYVHLLVLGGGLNEKVRTKLLGVGGGGKPSIKGTL
jgi:hypothetical protein